MSSPPERLPVLGAGRHRSPRQGSCFMEHASVLSGARWSDDPKVTHPLLATLARHVNDRSTDEGRQRLVRLVPLVLTGHRTDPALGHRLVRRLALRAVDVARGPRRRTLYVALLAADDACGPDSDGDRRQVAVLLSKPDQDLRSALSFRRHAPRADAYGDRAMHAAVGLSVDTLADHGGARADDLLHDLLADAIALVRGEDAPQPARAVVPRRSAVPARGRVPAPRRGTTAWTRAAGTGVRAG